MRTCTRCHAATPTGLRFCNYCGARLGAQDAAEVFGSLALAPRPRDEPPAGEVPPYQPPRHLRVVPDAPPAAERPLERAGQAARRLAVRLPEGARKIAQAASQAAQRLGLPRVASRGEVPEAAPTPPRARPTPVPRAAPATPAPAARARPQAQPRPRPPSTPTPEVAQAQEVHPDLRDAYRLYLAGRKAYDEGDRPLAARLFAKALRRSPPESPLGQFLRKVVRPPAQAAPARATPARAAPAQAAPAPAAPAHAPPARPAAPARPATPARPAAPARASASAPSRVPRRAGHLQVLAGAAVARPRAPEESPEAPRARARRRAQKSWFQDLPTRSPNRPSILLEEADGGADMERLAGLALLGSATLFLALLFL